MYSSDFGKAFLTALVISGIIGWAVISFILSITKWFISILQG